MHFYQTDPNFIEAFLENESFRILKDTSGVFHPKIYLFTSGDSWDLVLGSPNLTAGGLGKNTEVAVHLSGNSLDDEYWDKAEQADPLFLKFI